MIGWLVIELVDTSSVAFDWFGKVGDSPSRTGMGAKMDDLEAAQKQQERGGISLNLDEGGIDGDASAD